MFNDLDWIASKRTEQNRVDRTFHLSILPLISHAISCSSFVQYLVCIITRYSQICPIVQASIGQHVRHSMDHIERVASVLQQQQVSNSLSAIPSIHYDVRERGGLDEANMEEAHARIQRVLEMLDDSSHNHDDGETSVSEYNNNNHAITNNDNHSSAPVHACFVLSGDAADESALPSTVDRELGFCAHHAIHHLAMVKIIVANNTTIANDDPLDLPPDFGRAPSTIQYDSHNQQQKKS